MSSLSARVEKRLGEWLVRLPDGALRRFAGAPVEIDGYVLEPRIQLAAAAAARKPPLHVVGVANARRGANASLADGNAPRPPGVRVDDSTLPNGLGIRTYRSGRSLTTGAAPVPAMLFMHQGGFVVGDLDTCDSFCARVCADLGVTVVSLDYRLAPEHRFPAQVEDSEYAWTWLHANHQTLGIDPQRIIVAGDSAGGHLTALLCQRHSADNPAPLGQLLIYPFVDGLAEDGSMRSCAEVNPLDSATIQWFGEQYLPDGLDRSSPTFSPAHGTLAGLPPAIVVTAGFDPLRDQGIAYADALAEAGVATVNRCETSLSHSFLSMDRLVPEARAAGERIIGDLDALLSGTMSADR